MTRFILTGAPGSGKTTILDVLAKQGLATVEEAATAVIARRQTKGVAEPWQYPAFIVDIAQLQAERIDSAHHDDGTIQFHDRSPLCTFALAQYLGHPIPSILTALLDRMKAEQLFDRRVFFVESLGFVEKTEARQIGHAEAERFGALHADVYRANGYALVSIAPDDPEMRALMLRRLAVAE